MPRHWPLAGHLAVKGGLAQEDEEAAADDEGHAKPSRCIRPLIEDCDAPDYGEDERDILERSNERRLADTVGLRNKIAAGSAQQLQDAMTAAVESFARGRPADDDRTGIFIKREPSS